jgi:PPOX class probable FMN-dependent enzyme
MPEDRADPGLPEDVSLVADEAALRAMHHPPMSRATDKVLDRLERHCRAILALSPFCVLATRGPDGADVSPRGDPPGFLRVIDERHVLLPDRVGNNRFDGYANLFADPRVGLLVLVPGMDETLRINGTAHVTDDPRLLEPSAVQGRAPKIGLLIRVEEAFLHCGKALIRSKLWDPESRIDRKTLPSYPAMLRDHVAGLSDEENERQGRVMAERGLY